MAAMRGARVQVGSAPWIADERAAAYDIVKAEIEDFTAAARNEVDWLNEHMAEIFNENEINVAELFKTPGKLRGKTPRTIRKANPGETRVPLSDIFSSTPKGTPNPFALQLQGKAATPKLKVAAEATGAPASPTRQHTPRRQEASPRVPLSKFHVPVGDSGYYGSQSQEVLGIEVASKPAAEPPRPASPGKPASAAIPTRAAAAVALSNASSPTRRSEEETFHSAKEQQTAKLAGAEPTRTLLNAPASPRRPSPERRAQPSSPLKPSPLKAAPLNSSPAKPTPAPPVSVAPTPAADAADDGTENLDLRSPSDGSSPIRRPLVRKSSLNFASLPAREPLNTNKSTGPRASTNQGGYYPQLSSGKSLGNMRADAADDDLDVEVDEPPSVKKPVTVPEPDIAANHNKTYTQRLQDQISKLGQSQAIAARPSRSIPSLAPASQGSVVAQSQSQESRPPLSPGRKPVAKVVAPGAFPEDDEDEWIAPPAGVQRAPKPMSPRPPIAKSYTADVMEGVQGKSTIGGAEFMLPKQRQANSRPPSPQRVPAPIIPERTTSTLVHAKSASTPFLPGLGIDMAQGDMAGPKKTISVSNPTLATVSETSRPGTPSKSPSRQFRDSPLKQVKNKLSSILKTSKGLLASSAAISAEGKSSMLSPSTTRLGMHLGPSMESLFQHHPNRSAEVVYPDLSRQAATNAETVTLTSTSSPSRAESRRTRASIENEKREEKRREKEQKEARRMAEQMEKLERAREKEREKARVFSHEQEKAATAAVQKEQDRVAAAAAASAVSVASSAAPATPAAKPKRTSPRKAKPQPDDDGEGFATIPEAGGAGDDDVEMLDAQAAMPPPPSTAQGPRTRQLRRPVKPTKAEPPKLKQAPTVIRINTGSQHSQFHPSNSVLASTLQNTLTPASNPPQPRLTSKASKPSLQTKPSIQSLKSSTSGRPKALDLAAKRKEQEEREAQRKRDAKAELERKRAAQQEEDGRLEQQQRERERQQQQQQDDFKKSASAAAQKHAAAIERAKQTRAPPPAVRSKPNGPPDYSVAAQDAAPPSSSRPPSRLNNPATRSQEEQARQVTATGKGQAAKRPLQHDAADDAGSQRANNNNARGPTYQAKDAKRRRTSNEFDDENIDMEPPTVAYPTIKGPPVRPSGGFKKELPNKSFIPPPPAKISTVPIPHPPHMMMAQQQQQQSRDLFKATVTAQQIKAAAHPLDMAQVSKAAIPFAPGNPAGGPSTAPQQQQGGPSAPHKTPARPGPAAAAMAKSAAKSAQRSSPRFPNGDAIELPEIQTDDDDSDDDDEAANNNKKKQMAGWADSPDLRKALVRQETMDPAQIFGQPGPINMEEVFSKSKDKWHKFRARTSSANWSGTDKLTEDDIRKDMAARDRMRRDGGWTYELSKDMV